MTLVYLVARCSSYLRTEARQREIRSAFSHYMSPHYVDELAAHPEKLELGGEMRTMTIMFCDIRGFTSLSEKLTQRALTHFMNSFLSPMTEIITEQKGTIDKYIGDCIMAFWNAPLDDPDHAKNAVQRGAGDAAQARRAQPRLGRRKRRYQAFLPVRIGIGINTGECVVGNFGSLQHFDYSLLGDPVNLASRLEGLGKVYGIDLMIGEETAARLDDPALIEVDLVAVKGKSEAGHIYTLPPEDGLWRTSLSTSTLRCWGPTAGRIGARQSNCSTMGGSPRRVSWRRSTISTDGASPSSRSKPRRPIGMVCSRPKRSELSSGRKNPALRSAHPSAASISALTRMTPPSLR